LDFSFREKRDKSKSKNKKINEKINDKSYNAPRGDTCFGFDFR